MTRSRHRAPPHHAQHRRAVPRCSCVLGWERGYGLLVAPPRGDPDCPLHAAGKVPRVDPEGHPVGPEHAQDAPEAPPEGQYPRRVLFGAQRANQGPKTA